ENMAVYSPKPKTTATKGGQIQFIVYQQLMHEIFDFHKTRFLDNINKFAGTGIDLEKIWFPLSHILALTLSDSLIDISCTDPKKFELILLKNNSSIPFITSDQPVVNTFVTDADIRKQTEVKELELYYPISPTRAVLITQNIPSLNSKIIEIKEDNEVLNYNKHIIRQSHEQIYSNQKELLEKHKLN
ncbi:MAG: DUF4238 domain-containing protein, partial [Bdellovibrionota bacterium]